AQLTHEIDVAHVDAELERRRRDERAQLAVLQALLGGMTLLAREAAVVARDGILPEALAQEPRDPLGLPARIREDERRGVLIHERGESIVGLVPDLERHDGLERRARQLESEVEGSSMSFVDDGEPRGLDLVA